MLYRLFISLLLLGLLPACQSTTTPTDTEPAIAPRTPVAVQRVDRGAVSNQLTVFGTTLYLRRNLVTAPVAAYITGVRVRLGERVRQGQPLYDLETKERRALGNTSIAGDSALIGRVTVRASSAGIISTFDKQQTGDYVLEGTQLCTIAEDNALAIQVAVPYQYQALARPGRGCRVRLPDGRSLRAVFTTALTTVNPLAQTQSILAKLTQGIDLPENLTVEVDLTRDHQANAQLLPKAAVLSDEMMRAFWVMKLINDSTAVKVPVVRGERSGDAVEIRSPQFHSTDRIVVAGNYGLPDTARVRIQSHQP